MKVACEAPITSSFTSTNKFSIEQLFRKSFFIFRPTKEERANKVIRKSTEMLQTKRAAAVAAVSKCGNYILLSLPSFTFFNADKLRMYHSQNVSVGVHQNVNAGIHQNVNAGIH